MPRLFSMITLVAVSTSCTLFGVSEIPCEGDPECPADQRCGTEGICVAGSRPQGTDGGVDAGIGQDATVGDDAGSSADAAGADSGATLCQDTPCAPMPDSPTPFCRVSYDGDDPCPPEGNIYYGQDGSYLIQPLSFVERSGGVIEEQTSGLMWEQVAAQQARSVDEAASYCDGLPLGGFDDWRLPELRELITLVDYGQTTPSHRLDPIAFPAPANEPYWSASEFRTDDHDDQVWVIDFWNGAVVGADPDLGLVDTSAVRCVRGAMAPEGLLEFSGGIWSDASTGLKWEGTHAEGLDWVEALVYCQELGLGQHDDWRLPSLKELETLIGRRFDAYFDEIAVHEPLRTSTATGSYWSSTPIIHEYGAWTLSMVTGRRSWTSFSSSVYARCVRGP